LNRELKKLTSTVSAEQIEIWRFQLNEIESAALKPDEEDILTAKRNRLSGADKLSKNTASIVGLLYSGFFENRPGQLSAVDQTAKAAVLSAEIAKLDPERENLHNALVEINTQLSEITRDFRAYMDELDADPHELDKAETRLDTIYRLKKKYGGTVEAVLKKQNELAQNLNNIENSEEEIRRVTAKRKEITKEITAVCGKMNALRTERAENISSRVTEILREIGMQNAEFFMELSKKTSFTPDGNDEIEFMILPNPGEPAKPLRRIASGGLCWRLKP
jgi:DNA repair protein RecN (Recombination protein N)